MKVHVRFFSFLRDTIGEATVDVDIPESATIHNLLELVMTRYPKLKEAERCILVAVELEYQTKDFVLSEGDEVCLFPPVQGG